MKKLVALVLALVMVMGMTVAFAEEEVQDFNFEEAIISIPCYGEESEFKELTEEELAPLSGLDATECVKRTNNQHYHCSDVIYTTNDGKLFFLDIGYAAIYFLCDLDYCAQPLKTGDSITIYCKVFGVVRDTNDSFYYVYADPEVIENTKTHEIVYVNENFTDYGIKLRRQRTYVPAGLYEIGVDIPENTYTIRPNSWTSVLVKYGDELNSTKTGISSSSYDLSKYIEDNASHNPDRIILEMKSGYYIYFGGDVILEYGAHKPKLQF